MNTSSRSAINRSNAQHSTGPKSAEGKKASSLNALRHGLTGQIIVMPNEDLTAYQLHVKSFTDDLQPVGAIEINLVQALADTSWRLNRVTAFENNVQAYAVPGSDDPIPGGISVGTALESVRHPQGRRHRSKARKQNSRKARASVSRSNLRAEARQSVSIANLHNPLRAMHRRARQSSNCNALPEISDA